MDGTEVGTARDRWLAAAMMAAGGAVIGLALFQRWDPRQMNPGIEGALTAGFFGPALALLGGLRFSSTLQLAVPIWIIQLFACAAVSGPVVAVLGLEMVALGGFGVLLALDPWSTVARLLRSPARVAPRREDDAGSTDQVPAMRRSSSLTRA
jgi:hypothetical protein